MDAETRTVAADVLATEKARGAMVVCVSHDELALGAADHIVRLDAGRVVPAAARVAV